MVWLGLVKAALALVGELSRLLAQRQLIAAGEAQAIAEGVTATLANIDRARSAAAAVEAPRDDADLRYVERLRRRYRRDQQ